MKTTGFNPIDHRITCICARIDKVSRGGERRFIKRIGVGKMTLYTENEEKYNEIIKRLKEVSCLISDFTKINNTTTLSSTLDSMDILNQDIKSFLRRP